MQDELGDPKDLKIELRRLRAAVRRLQALDIGDPNFAADFEAIKQLTTDAMNRVDVCRGRDDHGDRMRAAAVATTKKKGEERRLKVLAEIDAIEKEVGRKLNPYQLVPLLNQRGNVAPFRGAEWGESTVRLIMKAYGRA